MAVCLSALSEPVLCTGKRTKLKNAQLESPFLEVCTIQHVHLINGHIIVWVHNLYILSIYGNVKLVCPHATWPKNGRKKKISFKTEREVQAPSLIHGFEKLPLQQSARNSGSCNWKNANACKPKHLTLQFLRTAAVQKTPLPSPGIEPSSPIPYTLLDCHSIQALR